MTRPRIGQYLVALGVGVFALSVLLLAYSEYLFTYDNMHLIPRFPVYTGALEVEAISYLVAAVAGILFGAGWVLEHGRRGSPAHSSPVGRVTILCALGSFTIGNLLGAMPPLYSTEGWQLSRSTSGIYFWDVAPLALIGAGWLLGSVGFILARRESTT